MRQQSGGLSACLCSVFIHKVSRIMGLRDLAIWYFSKWPPVAILDLIQPEMAQFDPPSPKTPPWKQIRSWSDDALQSYGHLKFCKMCELAMRSVVGRSSVGCQYSYFLHWSHILLLRSARRLMNIDDRRPTTVLRALSHISGKFQMDITLQRFVFGSR